MSVFFLLVLGTALAWAQAVSGTLSGRVTAASGAGVPNAAVTITNTDTNVSQRVLTGPDGSFSVAGLAPGTYRLDVETAGFKRTSQQNIQLSSTAPATVNITLQAGNMNEVVEIKGTAPNIQTQDAELGLGIETRTVRELPLIHRNYEQLVQMQTGISPPRPAFPALVDPAQNRFYSTNGQDPSINMWMLDGVSNREPFRGTAVRVPPVASIQQFNVITGNWRAEHGYTGGTWAENQMRGGTNPWHGSLFEFNSINGLQSRASWDHSPNPQPRFTYNQFGGALGGRIISDKTFFFGSYEGTYNHGQNPEITTVPSAAMAAGNFSAFSTPIFNPATGATGVGRTPFTGNVIPPGFINPNSAALAAALPAPNLPGLTNNYLANIPYQNDWQKADARIDQHFSDRTSAFLRYGYSNLHALDDSILGPALGGGGHDRILGQNAVADITHSFSPSLITDFRVGYNRYETKMFGNGGTLGGTLGFANGLPNISIPGMASFGNTLNAPMHGVDNDFDFVWNWGWHHNRQNIKVGTDIRRLRSDGFYNALAFGPFGGAYFGPGSTLSPGIGTLTPDANFANSFAGFLLGAPTTTGATAFSESPTIRQSWYSLYVRDNIQLARRFSLDIGGRWDVFSPLEPRRAGGAMFYDPATNALSYAGIGGTGMHNLAYDLNNVSPHIGLAFTPTNKTVVRAGYSINYFQQPYAYTGFSAPVLGVASGVAGGFTTAPGGLTPGALTTPVAGTLTNGTAAPNVPLSVMSTDQHTPYVQSFDFQIQQEFQQNMMLSIGYVGTLGRDLPYTQELNAALPGAGVAGLPFAAFGRTASTILYNTGMSSNYNSLQARLTKRFAHGLAFEGAYTYSRALGYTSGPNNFLLNPFNRSANYGLMDYDHMHVLTISHLWELPFGAGTNHLNSGWVGQVLGDWQINGIFTWETGSPLTVTADSPFCNCPNTQVLANVNPGAANVVGNTGIGVNYLNPAAFSIPAAGSFGNIGRGSVYGPGMRNYDLSLFRSFPIRDQYKLEFRGEAYNLTNSPHWLNPVTNLNSPLFGQSTGTLNGAFGRQINVAVRVLF